ncbi:hypothetical protein PVOR_12280 [Paenibacillus vortex V453]|uniref:Uncharacterized protein n=1 Tax=Paenibacillus vortex V453 TaxID=715225 RepID=A0A2R9SWK6_9BACL|nr:hypothetical protein PVOR_12280 [Paenibacillus vortex V453]
MLILGHMQAPAVDKYAFALFDHLLDFVDPKDRCSLNNINKL